ncbi:type I-E CRISPR-associated protein Cse2/CasB [Solwaraspora sp. WMMD406]|uniref:type I-E CRISPR-associated protein Cse2/CasB n=1 Tax=Solwaraspora sp. WMMD406 TaxID=3016095 RepID=UPI0024173D99|nr:type I-E CRISPR-associated protein Cse2/CasB [Solwaraspora sp. WMMD406]MDG4765923.1 type I-E CRISPR-associated protein Cse2/CasB [Solwaraspora sp. WMMD406]
MSQTSTPTRASARLRTPFGNDVAATVVRLQTGYLKELPAAIASLARLRAAAGTLAGSRLDILSDTAVDTKFLSPRVEDDPEPVEHAKHAALTLYAVHQQSNRERGMHRDGFGFGQAVALLAKESSSPDAVRRRFVAVGTAVTFTEALHHCRGLVRLLRDKRIALDYGLFADDLRTFQTPGGPDTVRSRWGREYHRIHTDKADSNLSEDQP